MKSEQIELVLTPQEAFDASLYQQVISERLDLPPDGEKIFHIIKRSIDARSRKICVRVVGRIISREEAHARISYQRKYPNVSGAKPVIIVGAGPAGLFAALRLIEAGMKPVILERGKDVQARRRDLAAINKEHVVNPESNYCFGEGGAGTYSDGKLYTRSTKRGDVQRILEIFVAHGATENILYDAHPHIGTNKLPLIVSEIRKSIIDAGGEIRFDSKLTDIVDNKEGITAVTATGEEIRAYAMILATGHSARDIFELLVRKKIHVEPKPFALGVRVEHKQELIDSIQYHGLRERGIFLPASAYSLVHQAEVNGRQRGVFSFCMCPGGFIVPAATSPGEVVVNGMSPSRRDSRFANSGVVMAIETEDLGKFSKFGALSGMYFQREIEQRACSLAGNTQVAPAQLLEDFVNNKESSTILDSSYQPGLVPTDVGSIFPPSISNGLRTGLRNFGIKMRGYVTNDAQVVGVESRTSSPVRIPRNKETMQHPQIDRLFPCGEGAGYAGGIVSAAMDGERCAEGVIKLYGK